MTFRTVTAYGLIAGLSWRDMRPLPPGMVCDLFVLRRRYDDEQHGIQRRQDDNDMSEKDFENVEDRGM